MNDLKEYKVEVVNLPIEKGKWYESIKQVDNVSSQQLLQGLLSEYAQLGYSLKSITPLYESISTGGMIGGISKKVICVFEK